MENIREDLIGKITAYLQNEIGAKQLSLWFFNRAASGDFDQLDHRDPLSRDIILDVLKVHEKTGGLPPRQEFKNYLEYFSGRRTYHPLREEEQPRRNPLVLTSRIVRWVILFALRIYIALFALCSLAINLFFWQNPNFFESPNNLYALISQTRGCFAPAVTRSLYHLATDPQFFYFLKVVQPRHEISQIPFLHCLFALLALLPPRLLTRSVTFTIAFPLLGLGTFYYWYITWDVSAKIAYIYSWERAAACLAVSGFIALPATLVFVMLVLNAYQFHADRRGDDV